MHIWKEKSERQAVAIIKNAFITKYDVDWVESPGSSFEDLRRETLRRILQGYPPNAVQWFPSGELAKLQEMRVLNYIDQTAIKLKLTEKMPKIILDIISADGHYVVLPTNIHGENWTWFNKGIYKKLKLSYPDSWQELITQAKVIRKAGYLPIAVGKEAWGKRLIFTAILSSISKKVYLEMMLKDALLATERTEFAEAFEIFAQLRNFGGPQSDISWAEATGMVANGKSAMQFMGDWANKEFESQGLNLGVDYDCRIAPNNDSNLIVVLDGFIFPKTSNAKITNLHNQFSEVVLSPEVQRDFNALKGSMPVIRGISPEKFNECSKIGMTMFDKGDRLVPSPTAITVLDHGAVLETVVAEFWDSDMAATEGINLLRRELEAVSGQF